MATAALYEKMANDLRKSIADGQLRPGEKLPSEAQLGERYAVSRITVRSALDVLTQEGLIASEPGRGRRVRQLVAFDYQPLMYERLNRPSNQDSFVAAAKRAGRTPTSEFEMRIEPAPEKTAEQLHIKANDLVCTRQTQQFLDNEPWSLKKSWYPMDIAKKAGLDSPTDIKAGTVRAMADHGFVEVGYYDVVTARMPTPSEADLLQISAGTPVLVHERVACTETRPTRVTHALLPADRNRLTYNIDDVRGLK